MKRLIIMGVLLGMVCGTFVTHYALAEQDNQYEDRADEKVPSIEEATTVVSEQFPSKAYFDVPLSEEIQDHIFMECEKYGICPAIIVAMIERESNYNPDAVGDNGDSYGLMQIQPRWHQDRMDRLGCNNLLDPFQNITVGIDFIVELMEMNPDLYWVLMAYNSGIREANERIASENYSNYVLEVVARAAELEMMEMKIAHLMGRDNATHITKKFRTR